MAFRLGLAPFHCQRQRLPDMICSPWRCLHFHAFFPNNFLTLNEVGRLQRGPEDRLDGPLTAYHHSLSQVASPSDVCWPREALEMFTVRGGAEIKALVGPSRLA